MGLFLDEATKGEEKVVEPTSASQKQLQQLEQPSQSHIEEHIVTEQTNKNRGFVALLYGGTGTGKTYVSMTFPEPIYIIDTENRAINTKLGLFKEKNITICEPVELKKVVTKSMDDIFDEVKSINNLTEFLSDYIAKVESGKIVGGTLVIDSITDVWSWIQAWMFEKLSKVTTKQGTPRADAEMQSLTNQLDWKVANNKHDGIVKILRSLIKYGVYIVFTAREREIPDYVTTTTLTDKTKWRCQKDVPFVSDVIFNLKIQKGEYIAICEKCGIKSIVMTPIKELNFEKIEKLDPLRVKQ